MKIVENRNKFFIISAAVIIIGIACMVFNYSTGKGAFNYDVEFSGGTSILLNLGSEFNNDDIAKIIEETTSLTSSQIQKVLGTNEVSIKIKNIDQEARIKLIEALEEKYGKDILLSMGDVSPTVSSEMQRTAILAFSIACAAILTYITIRFRDIRMGGSAILALIHDGLVVLSAYAILRIPLNIAFIAAILTVLGYSINATIVVFDRVRENKRLMRKRDSVTLIDTSITQTMERSIYTSVTTLLTIVCLYIFAVSSIKDFTLPIIIGIVCGTYSSVCLAGSIWYVLSEGKRNQWSKAQ